MKTKWILGLCAALLGGALVANDAEAGRLGGARSSGVQRSVSPSKPAQQQAAPQQQPHQQAAPQSAGSRWAPILGGLALGGILGYLFGGNGLLGIALLALLAIGAVLAFRALARGAPQRVQYAGLGERQETMAPPASQGATQAQPK